MITNLGAGKRWKGDGETIEFPFDFEVGVDTQFRMEFVAIDGTRSTIDPKNYEVNVNSDMLGGKVLYPYPVGFGVPVLQEHEEIAIIRTTPLTQASDFQNQGSYYPEMVETGFDKLTLIAQELAAYHTSEEEGGIVSGETSETIKFKYELNPDTNAYTDVEKAKLAGIEPLSQKNTVLSVAGRLGNIVLSKNDVGLNNVDNTADVNKPVSIPQNTLLVTSLNSKVDKVTGKQLSTEDFTTTYKITLDDLPNALATKVDKVDGMGLSRNDYTNVEKAKLATIQEGAQVNDVTTPILNAALDLKVDKLEGFGLSANDYTNLEKAKLGGIEENAQVNEITGPILNAALDLKVDKVTGMSLTSNDYIDADKNKLAGIESGAQVNDVTPQILSDALDLKVDKEDGMALSENDFTDAYKAKLDGIAAGAQVNTVSPSDLALKVDKVSGMSLTSNDYTDDEKTKLADIEEGAQVNDVTTPILNSALALKVDKLSGFDLSSNDYTTAEKTKLANIEEGAQVNDVTTSILNTALALKVDKVTGMGLSTNDYSDADKQKVAEMEDAKFKGMYNSMAELTAAYPTGDLGWYAYIFQSSDGTTQNVSWDSVNNVWVEDGTTGGETAVSVKEKYESNPDTNAYTDAEKTKLAGIAAGAQVNEVTAASLATSLGTKVDKVTGKVLSTNDFTAAYKTKLDGIAAGAQVNEVTSASLATSLGLKVDKVTGKQLSTNDYTTVEKTKLAGIATGAQVNEVTATMLATKVDKVTNMGLSSNDYTTVDKTKLAGIAVGAQVNEVTSASVAASLALKVDKVTGKVLSTNDYTAAEKTKLAGIAAGAQVGDVTTAALNTALANKVNVVSGKQLSTNDFTAAYKTKLDGIAAGAQVNEVTSASLTTSLNTKVDKVTGQGLSTNNYTTAEKTKLAGIAAGAQVNPAVATQTVNGLMSFTDKKKLDGISNTNDHLVTLTDAAGANILPNAGTSTYVSTLLQQTRNNLKYLRDRTIEAGVDLYSNPIGTIIALFTTVTPPGYLKCNGGTYSKTDYPDLYASIGNTFGGVANSTFKVPDLRGEFLRGFDEARGVDAGRTLGSFQGDAIRNIVGNFGAVALPSSSVGFTGPFSYSNVDIPFGGGTVVGRLLGGFNASKVVPTAADNRPRNFSVCYYIKALGAANTYSSVLMADVVSRLSQLEVNSVGNSVPIGFVISGFNATPPSGYIKCNGALISKTTYADLYAVLGNMFGQDSSGNFRVPDLRGQFLRGLDEGRGVDSGRVLGSTQGDTIRNITGQFGMVGIGDVTFDNGAAIGNGVGVFTNLINLCNHAIAYNEKNLQSAIYGVYFDTSLVVPTSNENRPRNVAVYYFIKAFNSVVEVQSEQVLDLVADITSLQATVATLQSNIAALQAAVTPITSGTTDLTAGTSALASGTVHLVYE